MALLGSCSSPQPDKKGEAAPLTLEWKKLGQLPGSGPGANSGSKDTANPGLAGPVAGISGDYLIIGGGSNFPDSPPWEGGTKKYYSRLYLYKLSQNAEAEADLDADTAILISATDNLPYEVGYPACVSTKRGIVVAGGENNNGPVDRVILLTMDGRSSVSASAAISPATATAPAPTITVLPSLPHPSTGGMATAIGDLVYFAGGQTAKGTSSQFLVLDLSDTARGWQPLPDLPQPVVFGVIYQHPKTSEIYIASGRKTNTLARTSFYDALFAFNTVRKSWQKKADLPYKVSAATGVCLQDKLWLFGGDQGETFNQTEDLLLKIAATKDNQHKQTLIAQKNNLQKQHPGFSSQVLIYDIDSDRWELAGKLKYPSQVTTTAIVWGNKVIIPCGEIRAGVRFPDIITGAIQHSN